MTTTSPAIDDEARCCWFCGHDVHPDDDLRDVSDEARQVPGADKEAVTLVCDFCHQSHACMSNLWNPTTWSHTERSLAKDQIKFANMLRDEIRRGRPAREDQP